MFRDYRISELRTLLNNVTSSIFRKNLISFRNTNVAKTQALSNERSIKCSFSQVTQA